MTAEDRATNLDAVAEELVERDRTLRRARLVARGRRDSARQHREMIRLLTIVVALDPYTQATSAPAGQRGRPIGPSDAELEPPRTARRHSRRAR